MQDMTQQPVKRFVRYNNRKIYDSASKSYVCAADLLDLVREGVPFEVVGSHDKVPYTAQMLSQVLWQMSRADMPVSPAKLIETIQHALEQERRAIAAAMQLETVT